MALIKCPECNKKISDSAEVCIHCGYPLKKQSSSESNDLLGSQDVLQNGDTKKTAIFKKKLIPIVIGVFVVIAVGIIAILIFGGNKELPNNVKWGMSFDEVSRIDKRASVPMYFDPYSRAKDSQSLINGAFLGIDRDELTVTYIFGESDRLEEVEIHIDRIGRDEFESIMNHLDKKFYRDPQYNYIWKSKNTEVSMFPLDTYCWLEYRPLN